MAESPLERLKKRGFLSYAARSKWISENKVEIVEYYKAHGRIATMKHYHIGVPALQRLIDKPDKANIPVLGESQGESSPGTKEGKKRRLSENELVPIRRFFSDEYEKNHKISCEKFAHQYGIARTTVFGWRRSIRDQTPVRSSLKKASRIEVTSGSIADALLTRVVEAIKEYDRLTSQVGTLNANERVYKETISELNGALKKEAEEKERILRLHNGQVMRGKGLTSVEELKNLAGRLST